MTWFLINWLFSWLVGTLLAYVVLKKSAGGNIRPFDMQLWSSTWTLGAIGAFLGTAAGS